MGIQECLRGANQLTESFRQDRRPSIGKVSRNDITDFAPELYARAMAVLQKHNYGPLFTPESLQKPTIEMPGIAGGASWSGAACDPDTGVCYISSVALPYTATLVSSFVPNTGYISKMAL